MRLTHRHRHHRRDAFSRISISEAEITADLIYPAHPARVKQGRPPTPARARATRR
jgi:hypothetical protein